MSRITVATFNTWNCQGDLPGRLPLMVDGLRPLGADVILLQEVFAEAPSGFHVGAHVADALGMHLSFLPARKKLRTYQGAPTLCHSGLAVLSVAPPLGQQAVRLPIDERDGERLGQIVKLDWGGLSIQLGNVHLTHLADADDLRRRQLQEVLVHLGDTADLSIIGGDMNAPLGHPLFDVMGGFRVSHWQGVPQGTLNPVDGEAGAGIIDHIYVRADEVLHVDMTSRPALCDQDCHSGLYPSDHRAVVSEIVIGG